MFFQNKCTHLLLILALISVLTFIVHSQALYHTPEKITQQHIQIPKLASTNNIEANVIICYSHQQINNSFLELKFFNVTLQTDLKMTNSLLSTNYNISALSMSKTGKYVGYGDQNLNNKIYQMNKDYTINNTYASIATNSLLLNIIFGNESLEQITYMTKDEITFMKQGQSIKFKEETRIVWGFRFESYSDTYIYADLQRIWFQRKVNSTWQKTLMAQANAEIIKMEKLKSEDFSAIVWITKASIIHFTFLKYGSNTAFEDIQYINITNYSKNSEILDFDWIINRNNNDTYVILSGTEVIEVFKIVIISNIFTVKLTNIIQVNEFVSKIKVISFVSQKLFEIVFFKGIDLRIGYIYIKTLSNSHSTFQYFYSINAQYKVCQNKCLTCSHTSISCQSCVSGFHLSLVGCHICDIQYCSNCSANITKCNKCFPNYYFTNNSNVQCIHCSQKIVNCIKCIDESICDICNTSALLRNGNCISCSIFFDGCIECKQSQCLKCRRNLVLVNNQCMCEGDYKYSQNKSICALCIISNCTACIRDQYCEQCQNGFQVMNDGTCVQENIKQYNNSNITVLPFTMQISLKTNSLQNTLTFYIEFNKPYKLKSTVEQTFTFSAANTELQYSSHQQKTKALIVEVTYNESLDNVPIDCKVNQSLIRSEKDNLKLLKSNYNLGFVTSPFITQSQKQKLQAIQQISKQYVSGIKFAALGSIILGGLNFLILLINFTQIISLYTILSMQYPSNLRYILESQIQLQSKGLYPIPKIKIFDFIDFDPLPNRIKQYGFYYNFIKTNYFSIICIIGSYLFCKIIAILIIPYIPLGRISKFLKQRFILKQYQNFAIQFQASALTFMFSASLVIKNPFDFTMVGLLNLMLALIFFEGCFLYVFMNWAHLKNNYRNPLMQIDGCLMDLKQSHRSTYQFVLFKTFGDFFIAGSIFLLPVQSFIPIVIIWNAYLIYRIAIVQVFTVCMFKYTRIISSSLFVLFNCLFVVFYFQQKYIFLSLTLYWNLGYVGIGCVILITILNTFENIVKMLFAIKQLWQQFRAEKQQKKQQQIINKEQCKKKSQIKKNQIHPIQVQNIESNKKKELCIEKDHFRGKLNKERDNFQNYKCMNQKFIAPRKLRIKNNDRQSKLKNQKSNNLQIIKLLNKQHIRIIQSI